MSAPPDRPDQPKRSILPLSPEQQSKQAVKTTIVGGQPPGNDRPLQYIPVGLEELLAMAAVNPQFARALLTDRAGAMQASGVELTGTEQSVLGAVDDAALERMVNSVGRGAIMAVRWA